MKEKIHLNYLIMIIHIIMKLYMEVIVLKLLKNVLKEEINGNYIIDQVKNIILKI